MPGSTGGTASIAYAGNGAWGMSLGEIMTAVRHDIPVTAVVFHNRQWGAEKKNQVDFYNRRFVAGELESESFAGIAQAMGAEGIVVDKLEEVGPALQRAVAAQMNEGKTTVIEIMCTRELGDPFRPPRAVEAGSPARQVQGLRVTHMGVAF
ncbi:thiamine pyrophosphate-dependent enzyme [Rhodococcus opacus]|uniref:thiamine pyrophosphate-dependent enzyme n=1 Tax=Rhodococcus opacus TaxID=37919 RepID=UPI00294A68DE|nr:thiamine pyrophosphate-dependent enzyme [Rhodococcus opacus]MDV6247070.1 thiamine pyrophosphate-dependent enzyme [Rhodococcus opacus]